MSGPADAVARSAFSRPLRVDEVPPEGLDVTISATQEEREKIAAQDGLEQLAKLEGSLHIVPWSKGGLAVTGEMRARITQICAVTLDPFESEVVEPIDVKFAPVAVPEHPAASDRVKRGASPLRRPGPQPELPSREFVVSEGEDPPDPIVDGEIDLGALVAEFLALGLDPYPRKPGVAFDEAPDDDQPAESPFAKLEALKGKLSRRS